MVKSAIALPSCRLLQFPFGELSDLDRQSLFVEDGIGEDGCSLFEKDVVVLVA